MSHRCAARVLLVLRLVQLGPAVVRAADAPNPTALGPAAPAASAAQAAVPGAGAAGEVGLLGDPAPLRIEGCKVIDAESVRRAIGRDWLIQLASTPSAPLADYLATLGQRVTAGFQATGYPEAKVTVEVDAPKQQVVLRIDEGPHYRNGQLRVEGAKAIDVDRLVQCLTHPQPAPEFGTILGADGSICIDTWGESDDGTKIVAVKVGAGNDTGTQAGASSPW